LILHGHEALACVGQSDGHRTGGKIEHPCGIKGVTVEPDDGLMVDRRRRSIVPELAAGEHERSGCAFPAINRP